MFCDNCGKQIDPEWKMCPYCTAQIRRTDLQEKEYPSLRGHDISRDGSRYQRYESKENKEWEPERRTETVNSQVLLPQFSLLKYIVFSILTFGIYGIILMYKINKTVNVLCEGDGQETPNYFLVILLGCVTFGVYTFYWIYRQNRRLCSISPRYQCRIEDDSRKVLLWSTFGRFILVGSFVSWHKIFEKTNILVKKYNRGKRNDAFRIRIKKDKMPIFIVAAFYLLIIFIPVFCFAVLYSGFLSNSSSTMKKTETETFQIGMDKPLENTEESGNVISEYEDVTVADLERNPEQYNGKKVRVGNNFANIYDAICITTDGAYITVEYTDAAYDERGNAIGQVLTGDEGYVEGTFRYEDTDVFVKSKIEGDRIVITNYESNKSDHYISTEKNAIDGQEESSSTDFSFYSNVISDTAGACDGKAKYALYDLDRDGTSELILSAGTCMADWTETIYILQNGQVSSVCSFYGPCSYYEADQGMYAVYQHKGGGQDIRHITKQGSKISEQLVSQEVGSNYTSYPEICLETYEEVQMNTMGSSNNQGNNVAVNYGGTGDANGYVFPDSSNVVFQGTIDVPVWMYQYGINEIYAKHGYIFQNMEVQELFYWKNWYYPDANFSEGYLSDIERSNISYFTNCIAASGQDAGLGLPSNGPSD